MGGRKDVADKYELLLRSRDDRITALTVELADALEVVRAARHALMKPRTYGDHIGAEFDDAMNKLEDSLTTYIAKHGQPQGG